MLIPSSFLLVTLLNIPCISEKLILMEPHFLPSPIPVSEVHSHITLQITQERLLLWVQGACWVGASHHLLVPVLHFLSEQARESWTPQKEEPMGQKVINTFKQKYICILISLLPLCTLIYFTVFLLLTLFVQYV